MRLLHSFVCLFAIIIFFTDTTSASEKLTVLDEAHKAVLDSQDNIPNYYDSLLKQTLFIFIAAQPNGTRDGSIELKLRTSQFNNLPLVNAFDTRERALVFGSLRKFPIEDLLEVKSSAVFDLMPDDYYVYLNPETEFEKLFDVNEVKYVSGLASGYTEGELSIPKQTLLKAVVPNEGKFTFALRQIVDEIAGVESVYVCPHPDRSLPKGQNNYLIILQVKRKSNDPKFEQVYEFLEGNISEVGIIDFAFTDKRKLHNLVAIGEEPFYRKQ